MVSIPLRRQIVCRINDALSSDLIGPCLIPDSLDDSFSTDWAALLFSCIISSTIGLIIPSGIRVRTVFGERRGGGGGAGFKLQWLDFDSASLDFDEGSTTMTRPQEVFSDLAKSVLLTSLIWIALSGAWIFAKYGITWRTSSGSFNAAWKISRPLEIKRTNKIKDGRPFQGAIQVIEFSDFSWILCIHSNQSEDKTETTKVSLCMKIYSKVHLLEPHITFGSAWQTWRFIIWTTQKYRQI